MKCDEGRPECKRCVNAKRGVSRRSLIVVLLYVTKTDALSFSPRAYLLDKFGIASASTLHCKICRKRPSERWLRRRDRIRGIRRAMTRSQVIGNELAFQGESLRSMFVRGVESDPRVLDCLARHAGVLEERPRWIII